jgi:hypothetical protein
MAASAPASLDTNEVTLAQADNGGWSTTVGLTNLTDGPVTVAAKASTPNCALEVGGGTSKIPAAQHRDLTVSIPAPCKASEGFSFVLTATSNETTQSFSVTAGRKEATVVDWSSLQCFLWALLASFIVVLCVLLIWHGNTTPDRQKRFDSEHGFTDLTGLDKAWTFKDSMVSSLTAASGLVAVVLGSSDFLKASLGAKAEAAIAVASIAGAIAVALVGAAGVLVLTLKKPSSASVSAIGLCAGTVVALGAAGGQVWTIAILLNDLKINGLAEGVVWAATAAATALLIGYAWVSLAGLLEQGTETKPDVDPLAPPASVEVVASAVAAAAAIYNMADYATVSLILNALKPPPAPPARRANLLAAEPAGFQALQERSALP